MAEPTQYFFNHHEVIAALLKKQEIHEGIWSLIINFGFGVANVGPSEDQVNPTVMIPVMAVGIQRAEALGPLSVDASVVNPKAE